MSGAFVLDAFVLLSYLYAESGGPRVKELLQAAAAGNARVLLSLINYGEAVYITERRQGRVVAQDLIREVEDLPMEQVEVDRDLIFAAASIKARYPLSYADAFAAALAIREDASLVTGDPAFSCVQGLVDIQWLGQ